MSLSIHAPTASAHVTPQDLQPGGRTTPTAGGITPELLTSKQAAELCGCGERTLWAWSRSGIAPAPVKIGCGLRPAVRFKRAELLQWIANGCPRTEGGQR